MPYSNYTLAQRFVAGATKGNSHRMTIKGDSLFSYSCCIAIRSDGGFIISNRARFLGGRFRSCTTSAHIAHMWAACHGKSRLLVDGWADEGNKEWTVPHYPTHKTVWGLIKSFKGWRQCGWEGLWLEESKAQKVGWHYKNGCLYAPNGKLVAKRRYVTSKKFVGGNYSCNDECDECPARFQCKTDYAGYYGWLFYIAKGKFANKVKKYLHPTATVEDLTSIEASGRL